MALEDLLARGYFPKELPNPFTTVSFAGVVANNAAALPSAFTLNRRSRSNGGVPTSKAAAYSLARGGLLRRMLTVPNPVNQHALAAEIDAEWGTLQSVIGGTRFAATAPVMAPGGRAIQGQRHQRLRPHLAAITRRNNRFVLKTDIRRFYHSIYTHSIPWAVHGKAFAKSHRGLAHLGNRLDALVRSSQDQQTIGVPIGPDTSLVIAEILMQACDKVLEQQIPGLRGHRFIDDYELGFRTRTEAERAFHVLESVLAEYELALNPRKTSVVDLPSPLEARWPTLLAAYEFRETTSGQHSDLIGYFNLAFELCRSNPGESVLQYTVARVRNLDIQPPNWRLFCTLLLDCAVPEPACLPYVFEIIINKVNEGAACPARELTEALNGIVVEHSSINHTSEVAWSLWACLALGIEISAKSARALQCCTNPFVALLALHADEAKLIEGGLDRSPWTPYMTSAALYEENWILAYEANVKGWLPSVGGDDHVAADPNFGFLKREHVGFYDVTAARPLAEGGPVPAPRVPSFMVTGIVEYD